MSDVYIPGVKSRFNSEQIIEDLMKLERVPKERTERNIENLQVQRGYWQEVGRRITSLRDSSRFLFSFQNPFNDRIAVSGNDSVITAAATREAAEQSLSFSVKQTAQADRFLSSPIDEKTKIEAGNYTFTVGEDRISINFRGGAIRDFVDVINRRGRDKIAASLISVQSGTKSLLIESKVTGEANRLGFQDDAASFAVNTGMMIQGNDSRRDFPITENTIKQNSGGQENININEGVLQVGARSSVSVPLGIALSADSPVMLRLETSTKVESSDVFNVPSPPPGPSVPSSSVTYGGITIENMPSGAPLPQWTAPPAPVRNDDMEVLNLVFQDGSSAKLPAITDSSSSVSRQYLLSDIAQGRTITSLNIENNNTHREVSVSKIEIFDPTALSGGLIPQNAVSIARDAVISMEGIEIKRPTNNIDDLIPGVTLNVKGVSERPVDLSIQGNMEGVKEAIISFVGNYNRVMAEINVLTRADDRLVDELSYLTKDEADEMRERLGAFTGDTTLLTFRSNLLRAATAPYPTGLERDLSLLAQIGVSSNAARSSGNDPARLRGYLEIDEKTLDAALETKMSAVKELFGNDTTGDMLVDTGAAFNIDEIAKPFMEVGGIISLKTGTLDSRIQQDERRVLTMERQLLAKEQELRIQYGRMESAYSRMEAMSNSLNNFSQQNSGR